MARLPEHGGDGGGGGRHHRPGRYRVFHNNSNFETSICSGDERGTHPVPVPGHG